MSDDKPVCPFSGIKIERRDFLSGVAFAAGALAAPRSVFAQDAGPDPSAREHFLERGIIERDPRYYPPGLTGMRGSHPGSFEAAHGVRDAGRFETALKVVETQEHYDLVVVGGGISGLSAAWYFKEKRPDAKILILENHDDFGGHAKRNEFRPNGAKGPTLISYGGTQSIEMLAYWPDTANRLLADLGVDIKKFEQYYDQSFRKTHGLAHSIFFDKATFGKDVLLQEGRPDWKTFVSKTPLNEQARKDLLRIQTEHVDYMPGLSKEEKIAKLSKMSFATFLRDHAKVDPQVILYFSRTTHGGWCIGIDAADAFSVISLGVKRPEQEFIGGPTAALSIGLKLDTQMLMDEAYIYHFPDGNASLARLMVRRLIPGSAPGATMEDVVTARFDYAALDVPRSAVRLRLNSTVVKARNIEGKDGKPGVEIVYVRDGKPFRVTGGACVMACWNAVIPYLCPEMPEKQKEGLRASVKAPLTYTNVQIRNWTAIKKSGLITSYCAGAGTYFSEVYLDWPVSIGDYRYSPTPNDPAVLHLVRVPTSPGLSNIDQYRVGRAELYATPFATFEREARAQLDSMFGPFGFDSRRDIQAITVNRWPHGYARGPSTLWDPEWAPTERPNVVGRQKFGRITIANSDAAWEAATPSAIDQAHRAVSELL